MERIISDFDASGGGAGCLCRKPFEEPGEDRKEVVLDVRGLSWQGAVGRTLARMEEIPAGQRLRHVNSMVPWHLLAMLDTRGYRYRLVGRREGDVHLLIWPHVAEATAA